MPLHCEKKHLILHPVKYVSVTLRRYISSNRCSSKHLQTDRIMRNLPFSFFKFTNINKVDGNRKCLLFHNTLSGEGRSCEFQCCTIYDHFLKAYMCFFSPKITNLKKNLKVHLLPKKIKAPTSNFS